MCRLAAARVLQELDMELSQVVYYTDSKTVLGYIRRKQSPDHKEPFFTNSMGIYRDLARVKEIQLT